MVTGFFSGFVSTWNGVTSRSSDWVLIMGAPPFFFLFVLGGGFCGLLCQDIVFDHGRVARYLLHIMG